MLARAKMESICSLVTDGTHDSPKLQPSGVPFIKGKHISQGYIDFANCDFITEADHADACRRVKPSIGDVLFSNIGSVGDTARVSVNREFSIKNVALFRPDPAKVDPRYFYYLVVNPRFKESMLSMRSGSAQPFITLGSLRGYETTFHDDRDQQRRIASILSAYDDLIENNKRRIAILEEMARRIYEEWFVRFRFPGHEGVRMVESELGLVPEGWFIRAASTAMDINPSTKVPKEGLKPFLAMNCLSDGSMLIDFPSEREGNSGSKFRNGDTLFARITPCLENGKTGFVQLLPSDDAVAFGSTEFIVLRSRTLTPEFVYLLARSDAFRGNAIKSMSGASGRQRVREACFDTFLLANPDQETLTKFAAVTRPMFRLIQSLALKNANLRTTRDLLLPKLISGELDVSAVPEPQPVAA